MPRSLVTIYANGRGRGLTVSQRWTRNWHIGQRMGQIRRKLKQWLESVAEEESIAEFWKNQQQGPDKLRELKSAQRNVRKFRTMYIAAGMLRDLYFVKEMERGEE